MIIRYFVFPAILSIAGLFAGADAAIAQHHGDKVGQLTDLQAGDAVSVAYEISKDRMVATTVQCTRNR